MGQVGVIWQVGLAVDITFASFVCTERIGFLCGTLQCDRRLMDRDYSLYSGA